MKFIYFAIYGNYEIKFNIIWWRVKQKKTSVESISNKNRLSDYKLYTSMQKNSQNLFIFNFYKKKNNVMPKIAK